MNRRSKSKIFAALISSVMLSYALDALADPAPAGPVAATTSWMAHGETSALDGKTSYVAALPSSNLLTNSIGAQKPARLLIRCTPDDGLEAYVSWPLFMGLEPQEQAYRIDEQPVVRSIWGMDKSGSATFLRGDVRGFIGKLSGARRLVVQAAAYHQTVSEAVFDLGEVAGVVAAAEKACS